MDIKAKDLKVGHAIEDGHWGSYKVLEVTVTEGWVVAKTAQAGAKRTFTFHPEATLYGIDWSR